MIEIYRRGRGDCPDSAGGRDRSSSGRRAVSELVRKDVLLASAGGGGSSKGRGVESRGSL